MCPDFDLCLDCFAVGAEITPHRNYHAYRVVDNLSFPVYTLDWGADEEMLLLEAVELYGLGNWSRVGEHVGKPPEDCRSHYFAVYVETDTFPEPKPAPEMKNMDIKQLIEDRRRAGARRMALEHGMTAVLKEERAKETPKTSSSFLEDVDAAAITNKDSADSRLDRTSKLGQELNPVSGALTAEGFGLGEHHLQSTGLHAASLPESATAAKTPARPDFGTPGYRDASQLMLSQQTGYNVKRNEFEPEYDQDAETIISELDFPEDEPEERTMKKLRLIDIYNRRLDERERRHDFVLSRGLVNVKRQQTMDRRRSPSDREFVGRLRVIARYLSHSQWEALADGLIVEGRLRARIAELQKYKALGMRSFDEVERWEAIESKKKKDVPPASQPGRSRLQRIPVNECALESELAELGQSHAAAGCHAQHSQIADGCGPTGMDAWRLQRGVLLDIASLPDGDPLTVKERRLCANERYLPAQYLAMKAEMAALQERQGFVSREDVEALPFLIGKDRAGRLHDFFVEQGWIRVWEENQEGKGKGS